MDLRRPVPRIRHYTSFRYVYFISFFVLLSCSIIGAYEIHGNLTDRQALLEFKRKLDDPLGSLGSWNSSSHFCQWSGVTCGKKHQRVTVLELPSSKLAGIISPYIGNLSFLRILDLRDNKLEGSLPPNLGSLSKLQWLLFDDNNLTGEIPPSYGNLSYVKIFSVGPNNLGGMIPESLGRLRNVGALNLGFNNFNGPVPSSIFNISSLVNLYIGQNYLVGSLPQDLGHKLPNLQILSVFDNNFAGPIPSSISNLSDLSDFVIAMNEFTGSVPSFQKMRMLKIFQISSNNLEYQSDGDLNFLCSLTNSTALYVVQAERNFFGGRMPACIGHLSTKITMLSLADNNIYGILPSSIGNLINLNFFALWSNKFSGVIPSEIGNLTKLNELNLSRNEFSGEIPESLGNLKALTLLSLYSNNLRSTIPSSLGNCQQLLSLDLSDNQLDGAIPTEVIGLSSLSIALRLSRNNLSGKIPEEVGKLQNLEILEISGNRLSGETPSSLGDCVVLEQLYMQDNLLEGRIPSTLRSLRGIQELNLSNNKFSGKIPEFFQDLPLITSLDLSYNEFNGAVPTKGIFSNASEISLQGNVKLCGGLPEFHLPLCENKELEKNKRRKNLQRKIVICSISGLLGVTLLVVLALIYRFKRQRKEHVSEEPRDGFLKVSYQSLLKATDGFSSDNLIGVGSFGSVFRGVLDIYKQPVVIKVLKLGSHGASKSFVAECEALRNIRHRNLVKVLTACSGTDYRGNDFKALVYEFMVNGSLDEWLHPVIAYNDEETEEAPRRLGLVQRLDIAIDVAYALEYLHHQCQHPMVHCDLKPSNVLLDEDMTGQVGDFGLVRFVREATPEVITELTSSIGVEGSLGYIAPEYGAGGEISTFGDIYSYGILVLEIFTGKRPTDDKFTDGLTLRSWCEAALPENVLQVVDSSLLQELQGSHISLNNARIRGGVFNIQEECLASILGVGVKCSSEHPQQRTSMPNVASTLEAIKKKLIGEF